MSYAEFPIVFECDSDRLIGILTVPFLHQSLNSETSSRQFHHVSGDFGYLNRCIKGVLILVGGPQYRAGSHRQFTLLARDLADQGVASLRFDYRGMGDSEGVIRAFDTIDSDIAAAIDTFFQHVPKLDSIVIWGLCDAASAALMYAHSDSRVTGLVLLNPWVHTEDSGAQARLKNYYLKRFFNPYFWRKLLSGRLDLYKSISDFFKSLYANLFSNLKLKAIKLICGESKNKLTCQNQSNNEYFIRQMLYGLNLFQHKILFILSENDLTAQEFILLIKKNKDWKKTYARSVCFKIIIDDANHTFSTADLRRRVSLLTSQFVRGEIKS